MLPRGTQRRGFLAKKRGGEGRQETHCRKTLSLLSYLVLKGPAAGRLAAYLWLPGCPTPAPLCPPPAAPVWKTARSRGHASELPGQQQPAAPASPQTTLLQPLTTNYLWLTILKLLQCSRGTLEVIFMLTDSLLSRCNAPWDKIKLAMAEQLKSVVTDF